MDKLDPKTDGASKDITAENIEALKRLFPECVTEGKVDFDVLRELLGGEIDDRPERYNFTWNGKSLARRIAQTPSTGTLRPCPEESVNWETTQNIFIEGDNLEVLKLLQKSYHKRVKMIYIDPPYNTGKEFIYPDRYQDNLETYLRYTGQRDSEGFSQSSNSEASGRYHTNWLNMMLPRLKLARNLLVDDGVIFISIDDHEAQNLRHLCDDLFGEENWLGTIVWKNATDNNPSRVVVEHEYVHVYAKSATDVEAVWRSSVSDIKARLAEVAKEFIEKYQDSDERQEEYTKWFRENKAYLWPLDRYKYIDDQGIYTGSQSVHNPGREGYRYDIPHPVTGKPCKQPLMGYRFPESTARQILEQGKFLFGENENKIVELKVYTEEFEDKLSSVFSLDGRLGMYDIRGLFDEQPKIFTNPKPVKMISQLASFVTEDSDIVLDFFAGSCTAAQAILELNAVDGASRRFLMVQLPEKVNEKSESGAQALRMGFETISDIGLDRVRRVVKKIESSGVAKDKRRGLGVRAFRLFSSNLNSWDPEVDDVSASLLASVESIKSDRTEFDILYELLLKYGLDLAVPVEHREIEGKSVYIVGAGALIVCLADGITLDLVEGIAALKAELQPEIMRVVFKDAGFPDDVVKTNTVQILRQAGIDDVKSL